MTTMHKGFLLSLAVALSAMTCTSSPAAEPKPPQAAYPARQIRMLIGFTPGTSMDIIARVAGQKLGEKLGQPVVVENKPGATGIIGTNEVARAAPDGYTLTVTGFNLLIVPRLYKSVPFKPLTDFTPISMAAKGTLMLVANPKSRIASFKDFVARARAQPGTLFYASPGVGSSHHMSMELLENELGIKLTHVPYKGTSDAMNDLMSGDISVGFVPISVAMPLVKSGMLKPLAVSSAQRQPEAPDVPTLIESGVKNANIDMWYAFFGPKNIPAAIVDTLNRSLREVLAMPEIRATLQHNGLRAESSSPRELQAFMAQQDRLWGKIIEQNHITID